MTQTFKASPITFKLEGVNAYGGWATSSSSPVWIEPGPPALISTEVFPTKIRQKDSISTPKWATPVERYVKIPGKKGPFRMKQPKPPVLKQLSLPSPPSRRAGSKESSYLRAIRKYRSRVSLVRERNANYSWVYSRLQSVYVLRMARFNAALERYKGKIPRSKKVLRGKIVYSVNNPFSKVDIDDTGWFYNCRFRQMGSVVEEFLPHPPTIYYNFVDGPGPLVRFEKSYKGKSSSSVSSLTGENIPMLPPGYSASELILKAEGKAIAQLFKKLGDESVQVGNMIAERAQTYGLLLDAVGRLKNFLHSPKRSVLGYVSSAGLQKRVSNDTLAYAFGVEPLVNDVYSIAGKFSKIMTDDSQSDMVKVRSGGTVHEEETYSYESAYYTDEVKYNLDVKVRYMVEYRVSNSSLSGLSNWGLLNPASILWEVTPWSFVIDWFLPISNFISSLSADQGLEFRTGTKSIEVKETKTILRTYKIYAPYLALGQKHEGTIYRQVRTVTKERSVLTDPPVTRLPSFKNPFSPRHFLLSMALWRQRGQ